MITATPTPATKLGVSFDTTDEQRAFRDLVITFATRELNDGLVNDGDGTFSRETWKKCAQLGIQGLQLPPEYGGSGADTLTFIVAMEALGYPGHDNGLLFSLRAQILSCQ